jgi:hypothetical protein
MAKTEKVELVEEVQETKQKVEEPKKKQKTPTLEKNSEGMIKLDLRKNKEDAVQKQNADEVPVGDKPEVSKEVLAENNKESNEKPAEQNKQEVESALEEVTVEEKQDTPVLETKETIKQDTEVVEEVKQKTKDLPENIQKVIDFMEETGGSLEEYVAINKDYSNVDDKTLLREYYQQNKKHLTSDEIDFLIEDKFNYDEDTEEERDIKRKKLAFKEEVAKAKQNLSNLKNTYYREVKAGSKLTTDQQKAIDFFNRYKTEEQKTSELAERQRNIFNQKTDQVFNDNFKGFEYNVGEKSYRFKVSNPFEVKNTQTDINNFVGKFLDKNNVMSDAKGYHKSLFTAMNPDAVARHFYEQGRSDAVKDSIAKAKNVSMAPRQTHGSTTEVGGIKVRPVNLDSTSDFKIKLKNLK